MDLNDKKVTLHPQAEVFLFQHYRVMNKIFHDVLGHLEIDYMGIALLTEADELLFFSSKKSIEFHLIQHKLWPFDACYHPDFIQQGEPRLWEELYHKDWREALHFHKQGAPGFSMGIAVPAQFDEYRVVYSFAVTSTDEAIKTKILNNIETLARMGRFCLQKIMRVIPLPHQQHVYVVKKPTLRLIVNNQGKS
jgi:hypothetical protein